MTNEADLDLLNVLKDWLNDPHPITGIQADDETGALPARVSATGRQFLVTLGDPADGSADVVQMTAAQAMEHWHNVVRAHTDALRELTQVLGTELAEARPAGVGPELLHYAVADALAAASDDAEPSSDRGRTPGLAYHRPTDWPYDPGL